MATVIVYLSFNGTCEAAFNFYKSVFGGEFNYMGRFKDMLSPDRPIPESEKEKIMHVGLAISQETKLLGCDALELFTGRKFIEGNNFSICISPESEEEAHCIFNALSAGGLVTMSLEKTYWGSLFGMLTDKFGISWMVDYALKEEV